MQTLSSSSPCPLGRRPVFRPATAIRGFGGIGTSSRTTSINEGGFHGPQNRIEVRSGRRRRAGDAGLSPGAIEQEAQHPDLEHRRPGSDVQRRIRRFPEEQSRRRDRMARQEGSGFSGVLSDPTGRRHRARHRRPAGRALGGVGGQRRAARSDAVFPERAGPHQALQSGLHVELRLRQEELHGPVLCRQDAALLQQADVQGGRPHGAAEELRRTHHLLATPWPRAKRPAS